MAPQLLQEVQIQGQKPVKAGAPLPLVVAPLEGQEVTVQEFRNWIEREKSWIEEKLVQSGAVLFKGCGLKTAQDFNDVVKAFGYEEHSYAGGFAQRTQVVGRIYTANEAPPHVHIPFHHEMAQSPHPPSKLFFFCELAPTKGGETPLLWSNLVVQRMQQECPDFLQQLEKKGLLYQIFFGDEDIPESQGVGSWKTLYKVSTRAELEAKLQEVGHGQIRLEWFDDHGVKIVMGPVPALKWDAQREQKSFFNYIILFQQTKNEVLEKDREAASFDKVVFGDGSPLPHEQILLCQKIMTEEKVEFTWEQGDLLLIDNLGVLHSRNPCFSSRRILASLVV